MSNFSNILNKLTKPKKVTCPYCNTLTELDSKYRCKKCGESYGDPEHQEGPELTLTQRKHWS